MQKLYAPLPPAEARNILKNQLFLAMDEKSFDKYAAQYGIKTHYVSVGDPNDPVGMNGIGKKLKKAFHSVQRVVRKVDPIRLVAKKVVPPKVYNKMKALDDKTRKLQKAALAVAAAVIAAPVAATAAKGAVAKLASAKVAAGALAKKVLTATAVQQITKAAQAGKNIESPQVTEAIGKVLQDSLKADGVSVTSPDAQAALYGGIAYEQAQEADSLPEIGAEARGGEANPKPQELTPQGKTDNMLKYAAIAAPIAIALMRG